MLSDEEIADAVHRAYPFLDERYQVRGIDRAIARAARGAALEEAAKACESVWEDDATECGYIAIDCAEEIRALKEKRP